MSIFKVILLLLIVSTVAVDSRARRKRRQESRSSAYYGANALSNYPYIGFALGLGNNLYPIGNNWYVPGIPPYPYNYQFGYGMQQPYMSDYGYPTSYNTFSTGQYGTSGFNSQYFNNYQPYTGQSYMPLSTDWLPLPGRDRRR